VDRYSFWSDGKVTGKIPGFLDKRAVTSKSCVPSPVARQPASGAGQTSSKMAKMAKTTSKKARSRAGKTAGKASAARKGAAKASTRPGKNLVVVESPGKVKTINRYLGNDYVVRASMGHVRDLPSKEMGVDIEHSFEPTYQVLDGKKKVVSELKKYARSAPRIFLATDLDREGEAIAWHLAQSLGVPESRMCRVVFNEITAGAIREAFANPRDIDINKVNAQQARRILDRIVGYELSPLLWRKVARGLSAGRVQSVAVRLIVDREREIEAFDPEEYWKISAVFTPDMAAAAELGSQWDAFLATRNEKGNPPSQDAQQHFLAERGAFKAELVRWKSERLKAETADVAVEIAKALGMSVQELRRTENPDGKGVARNRVEVVGQIGGESDAKSAPDYIVSEIKQRDSRSRPPAPFTTVSLQQAASVQLRFSTSRTMRLAQQLYEGVDLPGEGSIGLITYMRTDSRHLSNEAISQAREFIGRQFGPQYVPEKPNRYSSSGRAQEAHEAIRPTDATRRPEDVHSSLTDAQFKLYELIWKRFVSCQMPPAVWKVTEASIVAETDAGEATFKAMGRTLSFDGFLRVAGMPRSGEQMLPPLEARQPVAPVALDPSQHFTQPPPRYTEASLVKALEADGIGRPSTYAPIIKTIQDRKYAESINRAFHPTDLGIVVTDKLVAHFPEIFDVRFTAHMEEELDKVEDAHADWLSVLGEFYGPFSTDLKKAGEEMVHAKAETQPSEYKCEKCGLPMVYRFNKNGRYLACTGYPDCKQTHPVDRQGNKVVDKPVDIACPKCKSPMLLRKGRFGPFLSCTRYPDCDGVLNLDRKGVVKLPSPPPLEVDLKCPKCDSPLYLRRGKRGPWLACSKYPKCRGRMGWATLDEDAQKKLELDLLNHEKANPQPTVTHLDGRVLEENYKPQEAAAADAQTSTESTSTHDEPNT